jgi:hypothetical protein
MRYAFLLSALVLLLLACSKEKEWKETPNALFQRLSSDDTGIRFKNELINQANFDVFRYRNYYNGGGVGIGDINNDGLADVFLTSNMGDNKLFLNKGNWKFEDITEKARVGGIRTWSTGVSMADVNADGLLDIYVCNSGDVDGGNRENELFINNGDLTFSDQAAQYGLDDIGFSTHAAFFDYDKDGDLDCYILNNSFRPISTLGYRNLRDQRDELGGHKLFRNDKGHFVDVSEYAGIYGSVIGFGLGVTVGDVNQDNWPDLYISNDFYERDYLYINNHDGTFKESIEQYMGHLSMFSMGADLADVNNDGYPEIFSTDMLPEDPYRLKTVSAFETYDVYQLRLKNDYYHQFMRNMLHLNNGDNSFVEIGELARVSSTDWSWGALMADFDGDSYREIFVCNGIYKDVTDQDFVEFLGNSEQMKAAIDGKKIDFQEFVRKMPSKKLSNYMFTRKGDLQYQDVSKEWGLDEPSFSNGAAYGDLDNDGDLDLIVNNVNQELFVYKNQSREQKGNNYLSLLFKGPEKNRFGLGATVRAFVGNETLLYDQMPIRGFQSSMDYKMIIGLGKLPVVDSLVVTWPDDRMQTLVNVKANQQLTLSYQNANGRKTLKTTEIKFIVEEVESTAIIHKENQFNDFDRDRLLYHMLSTQGPAFTKGDLNKDGLDDFYIGGAAGKPGAVFLQKKNGEFLKTFNPDFDLDSLSEDVSASFFDADGDKDLDLFVVSGGSEYTSQSRNNIDRLYINKGIINGQPEFEKYEKALPVIYHSGSSVEPADVDNDGDIDLFVGTRSIPSYYGLPCDQFLLINDGHGVFADMTGNYAPQFKKLGMVTDAAWFDYDHNGFVDLIIVGEWMRPTIFSNDGKQLVKLDVSSFERREGWWNSVAVADIDKDGDNDFILGNLGLNSKFKPTPDAPVSLYVNDFDQNGSIEPIFTYPKDGKQYPIGLRQDMVKQMSSLKKKFLYYKDYADKSMDDIFDKKLLENATVLKFFEPNTSVIINNGLNDFEVRYLPVLAQASPIYGIEVLDINADGNEDLIIGGNLYAVKPEVGRYDALAGLILLGDGKGTFSPVPSAKSGLKLNGQVRHIETLATKEGRRIAFIRNNESVKFFKIK